MSNGKGIALIEAAIRNALATKTGLGYNEIDLKNLARYTIGNWKYVEAEIDSLRAQLKQARERIERLRSSALDLQYYVNNPSAWDQYDDAMSERIRPVVDAALALTTNSEAAGDA